MAARTRDRLFQEEQNGKYQCGKNKATQGKIHKRVFRDGHGLPHFTAIIRVTTAEIKAARAAIRPETATTHVAAFSFLSLLLVDTSFFLAVLNYTLSGPVRSRAGCHIIVYGGHFLCAEAIL
jgi:hypothetical protein